VLQYHFKNGGEEEMSVGDDLFVASVNARKPRQCTSNWRTQKPCPVTGCGQLKSRTKEHTRSCHRELTPADIDRLMKTIPQTRRRRKTGGKSASTTASLPIMDIQLLNRAVWDSE